MLVVVYAKKDIYRCLDHHNVTYISSRITFISSQMKFRPYSNGNANSYKPKLTNFIVIGRNINEYIYIYTEI